MSKHDYKGGTSVQFNASDADITVRSSDNMLFRLHSTNIEVQAGEFTPINQQRLPEPAHVLIILFQFLYPNNHPKLTNTSFETVNAVATAAEKYKIFSAMHISQVRLREFLPQHAKEILKYAIEFDHLDLVDETARLCSRLPLCDMLEGLPSQTWVSWALYHDAWEMVFETVIRKLGFKSAGGLFDKHDYCAYSGMTICAVCQISLMASVDQIRKLNSLHEAEQALTNAGNTIGKPNAVRDLCMNTLGGACRQHPDRKCMAHPDIMQRCRDGIQAMQEFPFRKFLKSSSAKDEVYTPAVAAISRAISRAGDSPGCTIH